ncbi:MAG: hypothetical protein DRO40_10250 [Thermoprotei archaeon]|nr:MAG: hypothetical protein DRO40_10250 [Thermoprotei archaeon]
MPIEELQDGATQRIASVLHYLIYHARYVQFYHELRLGVGDDVGKLSDLIGRAQREFIRLKEDEEHREYIMKMAWPGREDIMQVQRHHEKYGKKYLQILLGMTAGVCSRCLEEKGGT